MVRGQGFFDFSSGYECEGFGIKCCLYFNQYCLKFLTGYLCILSFRIFFRHLFTLCTNRSKQPLHHGALSRLKVHFTPLLARCLLTATELNRALNVLEADLKVFPLSEFNSQGNPRRAENRQKFRIKVSAVKSGTVSRCTALGRLCIYARSSLQLVSP